MTADEIYLGSEESEQPTEPRGRFGDIVNALRESAKTEGVPGASVAMFAGGKLQVAHFGHDGLPEARLRGDGSKQHISCLVKAMIAYVSLMMVERGLVGLDEPLGGKLPEAVRRRGGRTVKITLRHLLAHTSGIDDAHEIWAKNDTSDLASYVARFVDYPQVSEPGEVFAYSECATAIAALLIERLLGIPWRRAVNDLLLKPLGIAPVPEHRDFLAHYGNTVSRGHRWDASEEQFVPLSVEQQMATTNNLGVISFCLTIEEVVAFARLGLNDGVTPDGRRLLSAELAREMRALQAEVPGHHLVHSWGLGWMHFDEQSYGFEAAGSGHQGFVQIFPEQKEILVVHGNAFPSLVIYYDVLRAFNGGTWKETTSKSQIDESLCVGSYSSDGNRLIIEAGRRRLRYRYFRRFGESDWREIDLGELVWSGNEAFNAKSDKQIRQSTITPIWSRAGTRPAFFRTGLRILKRDVEITDDGERGDCR